MFLKLNRYFKFINSRLLQKSALSMLLGSKSLVSSGYAFFKYSKYKLKMGIFSFALVSLYSKITNSLLLMINFKYSPGFFNWSSKSKKMLKHFEKEEEYWTKKPFCYVNLFSYLAFSSKPTKPHVRNISLEYIDWSKLNLSSTACIYSSFLILN